MTENRKFARFPVKLSATFPAADGRIRSCKVTEVSEAGVRLWSRDKIGFGRRLAMKIALPGREAPLEAEVLVRWSKELYDDTNVGFLAGGELKGIEEADREVLLRQARVNSDD